MRRTVMNVAEKPSVAKELANILSRGTLTSSAGRSIYNRIFEFNCEVSNLGNCTMLMTSITGHLKTLDFGPEHRTWNSCAPSELFKAPIFEVVQPDKLPLEEQLKDLARRADVLFLWLDCDREGEAISYEVIESVRAIKPGIMVLRARFSALIAADIFQAVRHPSQPDRRQAEAVRARSEIDLRLGCAFTRLQTLALGSRFDELAGMQLSYGPCQFPTLGFVFDRYRLIQAFVPETFWTIQMAVEQGGQLNGEEEDVPQYDDAGNMNDEGDSDGEPSGGSGPARRKSRYNARPNTNFSDAQRRQAGTINFSWLRGRLYDHLSSVVLYERAVDAGIATVVSVHGSVQSRHRPIPMNTLELQTTASRLLRMSSKDVMDWAEKLYNEGYTSYPRTETESFKEGTDLLGLVGQHTAHPAWGVHAAALIGGKFTWPSDGAGQDNAHPPIHPLRSATRVDFASKEHGDSLWRVYELITRHFLACCSQDATGQNTRVEVDMGGERFSASGTTVTDYAWLAVYVYSKWGGGTIPNFIEGGTFEPSSLLLHQGNTIPPDLLSEAELLEAMDMNKIGTDATMAAHISTIQDRQYASRDPAGKFSPTTLGMALLAAYEALDIPLGKPWLRANMESACNAIEAGTRTRDEVISSCLNDLRPQYDRTLANIQRIAAEMAQYLSPVGSRVNQPGEAFSENNWQIELQTISKCGGCGNGMELRTRSVPSIDNGEKRYTLFCRGCNQGWSLPRYLNGVQPHSHECPLCQYGVVSVTKASRLGSGTDTIESICPKCVNDPPAQYNGAAGDAAHATVTAMTCNRCTARTICKLATGSKRMVAGSVPERQQAAVRLCGAGGTCKGFLQLMQSHKDGKWRAGCDLAGRFASVGGCKHNIWFPSGVQAARLSARVCGRCTDTGAGITVRMVEFAFIPTSAPAGLLKDIPKAAAATPGLPAYNFTGCIFCDDNLPALGLSSTAQVSIGQQREAAALFRGQQPQVQPQAQVQHAEVAVRGARPVTEVIDVEDFDIGDIGAEFDAVMDREEAAGRALVEPVQPLAVGSRAPAPSTTGVRQVGLSGYAGFLHQPASAPLAQNMGAQDRGQGITPPPVDAAHIAGPPCIACKQPTKQMTVGPTKANAGRQFWSCATSTCTRPFGGWCDEQPRQQASRASNGPISSFGAVDDGPAIVCGNTNGIDVTSTGEPICPKHRLACRSRASGPASKNPGRLFFSCKNSMPDSEDKCDSFWWADEQLAPKSRDRSGGVGAAGAGGGVVCYKCQEPGHFASACPNRGSAGGAGRGQGASAGPGQGASGSGCYKCGEVGHFAAQCQSGLAGDRQSGRASRGADSEPAHGKRKRGGEEGGGASVPRKCSACGQPGHTKARCSLAGQR